jgi:uncharacterized protein YktB (UPF0637 family)
MPVTPFDTGDFDVFRIRDFPARMAAIQQRIRPKLEALGQEMAQEISRLVGGEAHSHVAKHARRTVNPPADTWVAFCADRRGYKKHPHFKVAISTNCLRFLFEIGPEFHDKTQWSALWRKKASNLLPKGPYVWFRNEHDEEPAGKLQGLSGRGIERLADDLIKRRDGQIVLGKIAPKEATLGWDAKEYSRQAIATFRAFSSLYHLA